MTTDQEPSARRTLLMPRDRGRWWPKPLALLLAALIWIPSLHLLFLPDESLLARAAGVPAADRRPSPVVEGLLARQVALWQAADTASDELLRMRESNAEWDFMARTFLVASLANLLLEDPARKAEYLPLVDRIIEETLRLERDEGLRHFLMPYAGARPFVQAPARSQFLDGEIALMLGLRLLVEPAERYESLLAARVETIVARMRASPRLSTESYPDECWTFCNVVALAAVKVADAVNGGDHRAFLADWVRSARANLLDPGTGLLVSRFGYSDGEPWEGPEGSSIWLIAHCLEIVDEDFAHDQYDRARRELAGSILGFGYAREWPRSWEGSVDVDAGVVIPILGAGAGASGMAMIAAAGFRDRDYLARLLTSLDALGFPIEQDGALRYAASNQVGDAVLLYALTLGPAWDRVKERTGQ